MTTQKNSGGRPPNLTIRGNIVRMLRKEHKWTQEGLAKRVNVALGRKQDFDKHVLEKKCHRWENENTISQTDLTALAKVLRTTETYIKDGGIPPATPDQLEEIIERIRSQILTGNQKAQQLVDEVIQRGGEKNTPESVSDDHSIGEAARLLERRIFIAQVTQRTEALEPLAQITGHSYTELLRPLGGHSHWLLAIEGLLKNSTEIHFGISEAMWYANQIAKEWRDRGSPDSRATIKEDANWYRVHLEDPARPHLNAVISLVRFEPGFSGLKWTQATEQERWQIKTALFGNMRNYFNFIKDFGDEAPWPNPRRMRLELRSHRWNGDEMETSKLGIFSGALEELADHYLDNFILEGHGHTAIINWLTSDIEIFLAPHLKHLPKKCWHAKEWGEDCIKISKNLNYQQWIDFEQNPTKKVDLALFLVEEQDDGSFRDLNISADTAKTAAERINKALTYLPDPSNK